MGQSWWAQWSRAAAVGRWGVGLGNEAGLFTQVGQWRGLAPCENSADRSVDGAGVEHLGQVRKLRCREVARGLGHRARVRGAQRACTSEARSHGAQQVWYPAMVSLVARTSPCF